LVWLGRHGSAVIAVGVFLGLAIPPLASLLKPLLIPAIVAPFLIALIRLDWRRLGNYLTRPAPTALALLWLLVLSPLLVHAVVRLLGGLPAPIHDGLMLMAAAPPLMASGALALMLGLDAALAVLVTMLASALMPFTLPPIALHLLGVQIDIALGELMLRLGLVVGGCFATAWCLRRVLPPGFELRHAEALDGLAVLGLLLFATAIMDGVTAMAFEQPRFILLCALAVFGLNLALQILGSAAFAWRGRRQALTLGLCSGNANLGLLLAAMADRCGRAVRVCCCRAAADLHLAGDPATLVSALAGGRTLPAWWTTWLRGASGGRARPCTASKRFSTFGFTRTPGRTGSIPTRDSTSPFASASPGCSPAPQPASSRPGR
jgi:BASS family bile acid:Na+ symporter